jgi:hypothetical protein
MYILILAALIAAIASGRFWSKTKNDQLGRVALGLPRGLDNKEDEKRARRQSIWCVIVITSVATAMGVVDEVQLGTDSFGTVAGFIARMFFLAAFPWVCGGAVVGGYIGWGEKHGVPQWVRITIGVLGGIGLALTAIGSFIVNHKLLTAALALPAIIALVCLVLAAWPILWVVRTLYKGKEVVEGAGWLAERAGWKKKNGDDEKAAKKAARAYLMDFVASGELSSPEMLELLKDESAYLSFRATHAGHRQNRGQSGGGGLTAGEVARIVRDTMEAQQGGGRQQNPPQPRRRRR